MDDKWIYGSDPQNIFETVVEGRPNGMPSFKGRIPEDQAWQIVAYVRSMAGLAAKNAAPSRTDSTGGLGPPDSALDRVHAGPESANLLLKFAERLERRIGDLVPVWFSGLPAEHFGEVAGGPAECL